MKFVSLDFSDEISRYTNVLFAIDVLKKEKILIKIKWN